MRRRVPWAVLFVVAVVVMAASPARAHLGHLVLRAERYLKIDVAPHEARVVVSLMLGPDESPRVLRLADANHDQRVDDAEATAYVDGWASELERELPITVDGAPAAGVVWRDGAIAPLGPVVRQELTSVELVAHVPLSGGDHVIAIHDRMDGSRFDRTDVAITSRDGATLLAAGAGRAPHDVDRDLWFPRDYAPPGGRWFTARARTPDDPARHPAWMAAAAIAVIAAAAVALALRARRK